MPTFSKAAAVTLGIAMLASAALATAASAATPKRVAFGLNNMTPNDCPARVRLVANIYTKQPGWVQVQFQREGFAPSPPQWIQAKTTPKGQHRAKIVHVFYPVPAIPKVKARVVVTGDGKTKTSKWDTLKVC